MNSMLRLMDNMMQHKLQQMIIISR